MQEAIRIVLREQRQTSGADSRGTREQGVEASGSGQVHRPRDRKYSLRCWSSAILLPRLHLFQGDSDQRDKVRVARRSRGHEVQSQQ